MKGISSNFKQPLYVIVLLILAGEAVFILPFVLARIFRPTFLDVFDLTNLQLGSCFSVYGIVAFISYLFGGTLADKFKPKFLIGTALLLTAAGGIVLASSPSYLNLTILYGYWGFTTIFLFWSAMIKATRVWGGEKNQGLAFGFLDGGRGLVAAGFGSLGVFIFSIFITSEIALAPFSERKDAFQYVILISSGIVALVGLLILLFLKDSPSEEEITRKTWAETLANFKIVVKIRAVWLLMIIILCAYVGYKITDVFSLYAREVMLFDEIKSAKVGTYLLYIRPVIGIGIGFLADKTKTSLMMILGFLTMLLGALIFASGIIDPSMHIFFLFSLLVTATGVYAFRTLYFAAMNEGHIPLAVTGTAVGFISLIGYTPDIFMGPAMGYLLDSSPGELGHQHVFLMLSVFAAIGFVTAILFYFNARKKGQISTQKA
jgi:sugar phosphate permease